MERLVLTDSFADEQGNVVPGAHYGMADFPLETEVTVTFEDQGGKTKLTLRHAGMPARNTAARRRPAGTSPSTSCREPLASGTGIDPRERR